MYVATYTKVSIIPTNGQKRRIEVSGPREKRGRERGRGEEGGGELNGKTAYGH